VADLRLEVHGPCPGDADGEWPHCLCHTRCGRYGDRRSCAICGETLWPEDERAEIVVETVTEEHDGMAHAQCYLDHQDRYDLA
jgi:hypothetical protein